MVAGPITNTGSVLSVLSLDPNQAATLGGYAGATEDCKIGKDDVTYVRVRLASGTYSAVEIVVVKDGQAGRKIDIGIYADDGLLSASPVGALLASTGPIDTATATHTIFKNNFQASVFLDEGLYWIAVTANHNNVKVACSRSYDRAWDGRLFKRAQNSSASGTLGALPGSFDAPSSSSIPYISIFKGP